MNRWLKYAGYAALALAPVAAFAAGDALQGEVPFTDLLRACAPVTGELTPQLRTLLQYHCGNPMLRTRQFMMDMQSL